MDEVRYAARPYRMRNDDAWMVCDAQSSRVVVLRLAEAHAATLAELLNVATLAAPAIDYERPSKPVLRKPRLVNRRATVRKPLP